MSEPEKTTRPVIIEESPYCTKHGGKVPVYTIGLKPGATDEFGLAGKWCLVCIAKALEGLGCQKCL